MRSTSAGVKAPGDRVRSRKYQPFQVQREVSIHRLQREGLAPPRPGSAGFGVSRPLMLKLAGLNRGSWLSIRWRPVVIPGDAKYGDPPPRGQRVLNAPDFAHRASWNEVLIAAFQSLGFTLTTGHHQTRCDCAALSGLYLLSIFMAIVSGSGLTLQSFLPISVGNPMFGAL
jgi:hypothetical protein